MSEEPQDQQFVEYIVKAIVDHPEAVKTERTIDEMGTLVSLHVSAEDMGTIIGKEGRTAKALRTLLRVLGAKNNARVNLKIIEPEGGRMMMAEAGEGEETPAKGRKAAVEEEVELELPGSSDLSDALKDLPQDELA
jgi:uncharacterized protein